jgi:hypothetical protein
LERKTRTREHIIADASAAHFEGIAVQCGYTVERPIRDYGIDMFLFTFEADGSVENDSIPVQLKATDNPRYLKDGKTISFPVECADLRAWRKELMPAILVLYDAQKEVAYWLHVQKHLKEREFDPGTNAKTFNVHFDCTNVLDVAAFRLFAQWKKELHEKAWKELYGDD